MQTAINPDTGERVVLVGDQWQPFTQSAANDKGVKSYLVNNKWLTEDKNLTATDTAIRMGGIASKAASSALAGTTAGAVIGAPFGLAAPGALIGSLAVPASDAAVAAYNYITNSNVGYPSAAINQMFPGPSPETFVERTLAAGAGALASARGQISSGQAAATMPGRMGAAGTEISRLPTTQTVVAPISGATAQSVGEYTESPVAGLAAGVVTSMAAGLRPTKREPAPSAEVLLAKSKANYELLDKSGFQLDKDTFNAFMSTLPNKLRKDVGYAAGVPNSKIDNAFFQLTKDEPKDIRELQALRKIIGGAAQSPDPHERLIASRLLDEFDDYVLNSPANLKLSTPVRGSILSDKKTPVQAWEDARADYSKMKKGEILSKIVSDAEISTGNKEAFMANQLSSLAKNDRRMKFFTSEEQDAIKEAAKSGNLQAMLKTLAKFTPSTPASAIFTAVSPIGAYTAAAGLTAKELAMYRQKQQIGRLSEQMRLGKKPTIIQSPYANEPMMFSRGVLSSNALAPANQNAMAEAQ